MVERAARKASHKRDGTENLNTACAGDSAKVPLSDEQTEFIFATVWAGMCPHAFV